MKRLAFLPLVTILLIFVSACTSITAIRQTYRFQQDLHLEDYLNDPIFQENYAFLLNCSPQPPENVCDSSAYLFLKYYRIGLEEEAYPYPTVDDMLIQSARWEEYSEDYKGSRTNSGKIDYGTLYVETSDGKEYAVSYINQTLTSFKCITDGTLICNRTR